MKKRRANWSALDDPYTRCGAMCQVLDHTLAVGDPDSRANERVPWPCHDT